MFKPLRAIDLFCGAGGSSYGTQRAGVEIVAGIDIWKPAVKTYQLNFSKAKAIEADIRQVYPEDLYSQIGEIDLILTSPECTNHSRAKGAIERFEKSRETAFEVIRFAKVFKPKWIVIENVIEMVSWNRYGELLDQLWKLDYFVKQIKLNAKDFGVPQSRTRLFILCSLTGEGTKPVYHGPVDKPAQEIIDTSGKYPLSPLKKDGRAENTLKSAEHAIATLGTDMPFLLVYYGSTRKKNRGWQRIDQPLRTITTLDRFAYVTPGPKEHMMRMLQPKELKFAMGFERDFKLEVVDGLTKRDRVKLMGNGVCPPVMEAIVRSLITPPG